jgi:twitching motility protein PilT
MMLNKVSELAKTNKKISDFHLRSGSDISYRALGDIVMEPNSQVEDKDLQELLKNNCSEDEIKKFEVKNELDTAIMLGELRFRANFFKTLNGLAAVLRRVETKIPLMEDLNLPQVLFSLLDAHKGLVLVTGPTGSGIYNFSSNY